MKKQSLCFAAIAFLLLAMSLSWGQALNASSAPFTFPALTDVKKGNLVDNKEFFKSSKSISKLSCLTFSWAIPDNILAVSGNITVYSLLGRVMKKFRLKEKSGSIVWKPQLNAQGGVYIVALSFGSYSRNLKIVVPQ